MAGEQPQNNANDLVNAGAPVANPNPMIMAQDPNAIAIAIANAMPPPAAQGFPGVPIAPGLQQPGQMPNAAQVGALMQMLGPMIQAVVAEGQEPAQGPPVGGVPVPGPGQLNPAALLQNLAQFQADLEQDVLDGQLGEDEAALMQLVNQMGQQLAGQQGIVPPGQVPVPGQDLPANFAQQLFQHGQAMGQVMAQAMLQGAGFPVGALPQQGLAPNQAQIPVVAAPQQGPAPNQAQIAAARQRKRTIIEEHQTRARNLRRTEKYANILQYSGIVASFGAFIAFERAPTNPANIYALYTSLAVMIFALILAHGCRSAAEHIEKHAVQSVRVTVEGNQEVIAKISRPLTSRKIALGGALLAASSAAILATAWFPKGAIPLDKTVSLALYGVMGVGLAVMAISAAYAFWHDRKLGIANIESPLGSVNSFFKTPKTYSIAGSLALGVGAMLLYSGVGAGLIVLEAALCMMVTGFAAERYQYRRKYTTFLPNPHRARADDNPEGTSVMQSGAIAAFALLTGLCGSVVAYQVLHNPMHSVHSSLVPTAMLIGAVAVLFFEGLYAMPKDCSPQSLIVDYNPELVWTNMLRGPAGGPAQ